MIAPRAWLPTPLLSILLLLVWLLLVRSYAFNQFVLGGSLAILIPLLMRRFWDPRPRITKPFTLLRFISPRTWRHHHRQL